MHAKVQILFGNEEGKRKKVIEKTKKMVLFIGNRGQAKRKQGTGETRTAD